MKSHRWQRIHTATLPICHTLRQLQECGPIQAIERLFNLGRLHAMEVHPCSRQLSLCHEEQPPLDL
eukprot:14144509-Ditylum_brightwellii.AAC.1